MFWFRLNGLSPAPGSASAASRTDRNTCVLFGEGAWAALLRRITRADKARPRASAYGQGMGQ